LTRYNWPDDLVLFLQFDEEVGNKAIDQSKYDNHGTIRGATKVDGKIGRALQFDGVDDYVEIPRSASLEPEILTICAWFKINSPPKVAGHIVDHYSSEGGYFMRVRNYGDRMVLQGYVRCGNIASGLDSITLLETGKWYFGAFVADGEKLRLYLNGKLDRETDQGVLPCGIDKPIRIGAYTPTTWLFNGIIDEVRIYNRALSEEEIRQIYLEGFRNYIEPNTRPLLQNNGLVLELNFEEGSGNKAYDNSGYKNDGTIYGAIRVKGMIGDALEFDGVDDYVEVPDAPCFTWTDGVTVLAWIKPYSWGEGNWGRIVHKHGEIEFFVSGPGEKLNAWIYTTDGAFSHGSYKNSIKLNEWQHVAFRYDGSNMMFFINGKVASSVKAASGVLRDTTNPVYVGARKNLDDRWFDGIIDEVKIYNRPLSEEEIRREYYRGKLCLHHGIDKENEEL